MAEARLGSIVRPQFVGHAIERHAPNKGTALPYREDRHPDGEFVRLSLESYPCLMADEMKSENRASA